MTASNIIVSILVPLNKEIFIPWCFYQIEKNIKKIHDHKLNNYEVLVLSELPIDTFRKHRAPQNTFIFNCADGLYIGVKRNMLMKKARGSYFVFFDADDWYHESRILYQISKKMDNKYSVSGMT